MQLTSIKSSKSTSWFIDVEVCAFCWDSTSCKIRKRKHEKQSQFAKLIAEQTIYNSLASVTYINLHENHNLSGNQACHEPLTNQTETYFQWQKIKALIDSPWLSVFHMLIIAYTWNDMTIMHTDAQFIHCQRFMSKMKIFSKKKKRIIIRRSVGLYQDYKVNIYLEEVNSYCYLCLILNFVCPSSFV